MWPHREKGAVPSGKKGGPSYGRADRPMDLGVYVVLCMYTWKYTQPSHFGKNGGVCPYGWVGGWKKWGPVWEKRGAVRKNPRPMGENGGGPWREGKNPPGLPGHHQGKVKRYGARRDAFGEGDGNLPVRYSPVALRYLKSLSGGIVEYLGTLVCTHTTTHPPVCTCGSPCLQATGYGL